MTVRNLAETMAETMGETMAGIPDNIPIDSVFDLFRAGSAEIVHPDEIICRESANKIYRWFARGSHNNKVVYAWGLSQVGNFLTPSAIINATIKHNHKWTCY